MNKKSFNIIQLPKHIDPRGNLTVAEEMKNVPFKIKSTNWFYGLGNTPQKELHLRPNVKHFIVPLSGSFNIQLSDGTNQNSIFMNHPYEALYVEEGIRITISDCANGTVILSITD